MSKDLIIQLNSEKLDRKEFIDLQNQIQQKFTSLQDLFNLYSQIFIPFSHFKKNKSETPKKPKKLTEKHIEILKKELNIKK